MKVVRTVYKVIIDIAVVLAIICLIATAICLVFQLKPAIVMSGSMEPSIHTGSFVLVDKKDTDVEIGDVIAYKNQDMEVLHRVTQVTDEGYITKGDNNKNEDFYVIPASNVIGTLKIAIPKLGYVMEWISSMQGIIIIVCICACLILLGQMTKEERRR